MRIALFLAWGCLSPCGVACAAPAVTTNEVDELWTGYFAAETARIADHTFVDIRSRQDWEAKVPEYRRELREMLGLDPWPERTPLNPVVTGTIDHGDFRVEKLEFQSLPGLYVTGNLYLPRTVTNRLPAILYVCGHGPVKQNGISYGNKVSYQHHGAWFARQGYVCLLIDTIQLGEIEGIHHGTYREGMWWWNSRGYTPAGVEAWNSIRAIDYLQSRPEVDPERIGMTGRSGGGAYTWWTAAIDERVKVAAPVAGITDLHNHVVDGTVEGHCDCMFMVNTHRWDYPQVAALVAPRPLLIGNTDRDSIFPLDGVERLHRKVSGIYKLLNAETNLALLITEGPHHDSQDLQVPVMHWFNRFLKADDPPITLAAEKFFEPEPLKVFATLPADQIVTRIHETFVPLAPTPSVPVDRREWESMTSGWRERLLANVFAGWPEPAVIPRLHEVIDRHSGPLRLRVLEFESQRGIPLRLVLLEPRSNRRQPIELRVLSHADWQLAAGAIEKRFGIAGLRSPVTVCNEGAETTSDGDVPGGPDHVIILFAPRGAGLTAPNRDARGFIQFRRRFMLLGQTLDGMRVWDIRQAVHALNTTFDFRRNPPELRATGRMAVDALCAALFEPGIPRLSLADLPPTFREGPDLLNVMKVLDLPSLFAAATVDRPEPVGGGQSPPELTAFAKAVRARIEPGSGAVR
jgi:dienelactone hydrolase